MFKKIVLACIALIICISVSAQMQQYTSQDSLEYRIQHDFDRFNRQHNTGTLLTLCGVVISTIGGVSYMPTITEGRGFSTGLMVIGSLMTCTGIILEMDSFKFLGGKRSLIVYPTGFQYNF